MTELENQLTEKVSEIQTLSQELNVTKETLEQQVAVVEQLKAEKVSLEVRAAEAEEQIEGMTVVSRHSVTCSFLFFNKNKCWEIAHLQ